MHDDPIPDAGQVDRRPYIESKSPCQLKGNFSMFIPDQATAPVNCRNAGDLMFRLQQTNGPLLKPGAKTKIF